MDKIIVGTPDFSPRHFLLNLDSIILTRKLSKALGNFLVSVFAPPRSQSPAAIWPTRYIVIDRNRKFLSKEPVRKHLSTAPAPATAGLRAMMR